MRRKIQSLDDVAEHNILVLYPRVPNLLRIIELYRIGFLNGEIPNFDGNSEQAAREEVLATNRYLDKNAYPIAEALYRAAFLQDTSQKRPDGSFLAVEGTIENGRKKKKESREEIHTVFAFNLGENPWPIYRLQKSLPPDKIVDTLLIEDNMAGWITANIDRLDDYDQVVITSSSVFFPYFGSIGNNASIFRKGKDLDLERMVPFMMGTKGRFGLEELEEYPNRSVFQQYAPPFVSYRFKTSHAERLPQLNVAQRGLFQNLEEVLSDWIAFRIVLEDEKSVYRFIAQFEEAEANGEAVRIGNYNAEIIYLENRYGPNKKENEYQDYKLMVRFFPRKKEETEKNGDIVAEIQVTDKMSLYNHDIDVTHPAYHGGREKDRKELLPPTFDRSRVEHERNMRSGRQQAVAEHAVQTFKRIFPHYLLVEPLSEYRK